MNIRRLKLQSSMPQTHQTMNIRRLKLRSFLITDTPDHATTSHTQEEHQREKEPRFFTAKELQEEISPELEALCHGILEIIQLEQRIGLPSLKSCERTKLKAEV